MKAAFYKGTRPGLQGLYNRLVRLWTRGKYSHVEMVFSDGLSASSSFLDGGVRFKEIAFDPDKWDMVELPLSLEACARGWFVKYNGKAYDYWAVSRFLFGFVPESTDKYQCAEATMASLGFTEPWRFEPNSAAVILQRSL